MRLLKFYAQWCNPCKQQSKILESLDLDFVESIDVDEDDNEVIVEKYNVKGLPTIILTDNDGNILERFTGLTTTDIITEALRKYEK